MNHNDKASAIIFIRPNAEFTLSGDDLIWLDAKQTQPTDKEIEDGLVAYQATQKSEVEAKAQAKADLLAKLGITEDEARLLLS